MVEGGAGVARSHINRSLSLGATAASAPVGGATVRVSKRAARVFKLVA